MTTLTLLALGGPTRAQATNPRDWTVTDPNGNPAPPDYASAGVWLLTGPITGTTTPTGTYQQMLTDGADWGAFEPFASPASSTLTGVLWLDAEAGDAGYDPAQGRGVALYKGSLIGGSVSASADSALSATLTYHPLPGDTPTPPDHVDLLLTTTLYASAYEGYNDLSDIINDELMTDQDMGVDIGSLDTSLIDQTPSLSSSVRATDTLGDQLSEVASSQDAAWDDGSFVSGAYKTVVGRHLVRVPVMGGVGTVSVGGHVDTTASNASPLFQDLWGNYGGSGASARANISTAATFDDREVTISCPTIEQSFYASPNYRLGGDDKMPWQPASDGSMQGDSAVAWHDATIPGLGSDPDDTYNRGWQVKNVPFVAHAVDFLNSSPTFSWSLDGSSQCWLTYPESNPSLGTTQLSLYQPDDSKFPFSSTLTASVTDSDGAMATKTYTVKWHLPIETLDLVSSTENPKEKFDGPLNTDPCYPGLPPLPKDGHASPKADFNIGAGIDGVALIAAASGQEEAAGPLEILSKLADAVDLKYHYGGEPANSYTNNQDLWNTCVDTPAQAANNVDDPNLLTVTDNTGRLNGFEQTTMQIWIVKYTRHKVWNADFYDVHGFNHSGTVYADPIDDPNGMKPEPYYTKQNTHNQP